MTNQNIHVIDLNFQNIPGVIACFLIEHESGAILVECGPGSTREALTNELAKFGYQPQDITDVLLTHIHLDHGGSAGWLSHQGTRIHVHPFGVPHLIDPSKLLASATRIYGDQMEKLWGELLPVLSDKVVPIQDGREISIRGHRFLPLETPGHASHHMVYLYEGICFSGDIGGIRISGINAVHAPMPPPEFHLELWCQSLRKIKSFPIDKIAPTHFGIFSDPQNHFSMLDLYLRQAEVWMEAYFPKNLPIDELKHEFTKWIHSIYTRDQISDDFEQSFELANPSFMSFDGMVRYWRKFRQAEL